MAVATLVESAKRIVRGKRDNTAKLAGALTKLRALVDELAAKEKFQLDALALLHERVKRCNEAGTALYVALRGDDTEAVRDALDKLEASPSYGDKLEKQIAAFSREQSLHVRRDVFFQQHPEACEVLGTVCKLRLEQARAELSATTESEQRRLDLLGNFEASDSPVVRNARSRVVHLEAMLEKVTATTDLPTVFANYASQLLDEPMNDQRKRRYINKNDREIYTLTIGSRLSGDGETEAVYQLKNEAHYWEGNEAEFQKTFEKS